MKLNHSYCDSYARRNTLTDTRLKARGIPVPFLTARHDDLLCGVCARVLICVKFLDFKKRGFPSNLVVFIENPHYRPLQNMARR